MAALPETFALTYEEGGRNVYVADKLGRAIRYGYDDAHAAFEQHRGKKAGLSIVAYSDVPEAQRQRVKGI